MFKYFLIILACYLLVRFIFGFVIPVATAAISMRKKMKEMQSHMGGFENNQQQETNRSDIEQTPKSSKTASGDYIDFEEIK